MRVSREKAAENRERVVEVAGELFRRHGFDGIGVADLMKAAGLTHGGFYGQFASKDDLAAEAVTRVFTLNTAHMRALALAAPNPPAAAIGYYLSPAHRDAPDTGCAIAALAQDAARGSPALRAAFEAGIAGYIDLIIELTGKSRADAMAMYATMVGALTLARAIPDPQVSADILAAAAESLLGEKSVQAPLAN